MLEEREPRTSFGAFFMFAGGDVPLQIHFLQDGEFLAEGLEALQVERLGQDLWLVVLADIRKAEGIDDAGAAAILASGVFADAVHAQDIALVLDGSGCKQDPPSLHPH